MGTELPNNPPLCLLIGRLQLGLNKAGKLFIKTEVRGWGGRASGVKSEKNKQVEAFVPGVIYTSIIPLC